MAQHLEYVLVPGDYLPWTFGTDLRRSGSQPRRGYGPTRADKTRSPADREQAMDAGSFDWHGAGLTVGQVAQRSGVAPSALWFYEWQGPISSDRTTGNQRRYHGECPVPHRHDPRLPAGGPAGTGQSSARTADRNRDHRHRGPYRTFHLAAIAT